MPGKSSGPCENFSREPRQPPRPATPEEPGIHASGTGAKGELPICSKNRKGVPRSREWRNAFARKCRAQAACTGNLPPGTQGPHKTTGEVFPSAPGGQNKQGSQQKPGSRNIVFIGHACRKSQNSRSGKLSPATVSSGISLSPGFRVVQQTAVQTQKAQPDGGAPRIVGGAGEPVNRDAGPGRAREQQEKPQSEQTHVRPGTGIHPAPGSQIKHHQRKTDLYKGVKQHEEPFPAVATAKARYSPILGFQVM